MNHFLNKDSKSALVSNLLFFERNGSTFIRSVLYLFGLWFVFTNGSVYAKREYSYFSLRSSSLCCQTFLSFTAVKYGNYSNDSTN